MIANQDNMVMKSIALLTMVFLPATFVSVSILRARTRSKVNLTKLISFAGLVQHDVFLL